MSASKLLCFLVGAFIVQQGIHAQKNQQATGKDPLFAKVDQLTDANFSKIVSWRRNLHQHPELGNREYATAEFIAARLRALGLEVKTGVAKTGVVALLKGGKPGPVVGLRADIDALPVEERNDLSFRSTDSALYNGKKTPVMHACGHDMHVAMLLGAAEILVQLRQELQGTVKFIFQPTEEGPPAGEEGGAQLMVKEGVLDNPKPAVIFGQHISSGDSVGWFTYQYGTVAAENDIFKITVHGKQSHGASPWSGVDPIVTASQMVLAIQTIISRNAPLTRHAAVITVGSFQSGNRENIIPEEAVLRGTIRTLDTGMRNLIHQRLRSTVAGIAAAAGTTAEINISMEDAMLVNDDKVTEEAVTVLQQVAGKNLRLEAAGMGAEDFAYFSQQVPGFYFHTGALPKGKQANEVQHHSPNFLADEEGMRNGTRALCYLTLNYMFKHNSHH
jgi:amidohydrolase